MRNMELGIRSRFWPVIVSQGGIRVRCDARWPCGVLNNLIGGNYEQPECEIIKAKLSPEDTVMEIGAGIGFLSAFCAKRVGGNRVFTYEANPVLEEAIKDTHRLNSVSCHYHMTALGASGGVRDFYIEDSFWASSLICTSERARCVKVPSLNINDEIKRICPTLLIVDIEGGEYEIMKAIRFQTIKKILIELHPKKLNEEQVLEIRDILRKNGYLENEFNSNSKIIYAELGASNAGQSL